MNKLIILVFLAFSTVGIQAQDKAGILTKEKAFFGGNITLPVLSLLQGNKDVMIGANPHYGYSVTNNLDLAIVLNFQKNKFEVSPQAAATLWNTGSKATVGMIGFGTFARLNILKLAFLQLQPEINYVTKKETPLTLPLIGPITEGQIIKTSKLKPSLLIGGGYKQGFNQGRTYGYITILYDLLSKNSPYSNGVLSTISGNNNGNPFVIRFGYNFSLADLKAR